MALIRINQDVRYKVGITHGSYKQGGTKDLVPDTVGRHALRDRNTSLIVDLQVRSFPLYSGMLFHIASQVWNSAFRKINRIFVLCLFIFKL